MSKNLRVFSHSILLLVLAALSTALVLSAKLDDPSRAFVDRQTRLLWVADAAHGATTGFSTRLLQSRSQADEFIRAMNQGRIENFGLRGWRLATSEELEYIYRTYAPRPESGSIAHFAAFRTWMEYTGRGTSTWSRRTTDQVYPWPVLALEVPAGFDDLVVFATNSIMVEQGSQLSGNVVVNEASAGATLTPGFEMDLSRNATVAGSLAADSIVLAKSSNVTGLVSYNQLSDFGATNGAGGPVSTSTPLSLPVFPALPPFQVAAIRAGAPDIAVAPGATATLTPGDYADITINPGGRVVFTGGVYNVGSILPISTGGACPFPCRSLEFQAATEVRIAGRLETGSHAFVGPQAGGTALASNIILYVGGTNIVPDDPNSTPAADVGQSSQVGANIWAIDGTLRINKDSVVTGALFGRDVGINRDSILVRASFFNPPPTADPQDVFTSDTTPLVITLTGSDPDNEPLSFSIFSQPGLGTLGPITPVTASSAQVTYTADQAGNLEDSFIFRVTDPNGGIGQALVSINPFDDVPGAQPTNTVQGTDQTLEVLMDTATQIVLVGFPDVADPGSIGDLEFAIVSAPTNGTASIPSPIVPIDLSAVRSASTTYTPASGFTGSDSFIFEVCGDLTGDLDTDDPGECDQATVSINVAAVAEPVPPVAANFSVSGASNSSLSVNLTTGSSTSTPIPGDGRPPAGPAAALVDNPANNPERGGIGDYRLATAVTVGGGWTFFNNCPLPGLCPASPFTFSVTGSGACVSVTDAFLKADQYEVSNGATILGQTSVPFPDDSSLQSNADLAYADPEFSSGTFYVGPGNHSINVERIAGETSLAAAYIRVDSAGGDATYCPGLPNLEIDFFAAPTSADLGEVIGGQIMVSLKNTGSAPITAGTIASIGFFISTDSIITGGDTLLVGGRENLLSAAPGGLAPGESVADFLFAGASVPMTSPTGNVFIGVVADEFGSIAESNEADNTASQAILIGPRPDLVVSLSHNPLNPDTETLIDFAAAVSNVGTESAGPSKLCFDIGPEECTSNAPLIDIPALEPGATFTVFRAQGLPVGSYQNLAVADYLEEVLESNENNNSAMDTFAVILATEQLGRLFANILTIPGNGVLYDSLGVAITSPRSLPDSGILFVPDEGFLGTVSFNFSLTDSLTGLTSVVATVQLVIVGPSCVTDGDACDDGRPD